MRGRVASGGTAGGGSGGVRVLGQSGRTVEAAASVAKPREARARARALCKRCRSSIGLARPLVRLQAGWARDRRSIAPLTTQQCHDTPGGLSSGRDTQATQWLAWAAPAGRCGRSPVQRAPLAKRQAGSGQVRPPLPLAIGPPAALQPPLPLPRAAAGRADRGNCAEAGLAPLLLRRRRPRLAAAAPCLRVLLPPGYAARALNPPTIPSPSLQAGSVPRGSSRQATDPARGARA